MRNRQLEARVARLERLTKLAEAARPKPPAMIVVTVESLSDDNVQLRIVEQPGGMVRTRNLGLGDTLTMEVTA